MFKESLNFELTNKYRKLHKQFIKDHTTMTLEAHKPSIMNSNFVKLSDALKIYTMDNITDLAKDVFGPFGGYYGQLDYEHVPGVPLTPERATYLKSKDGHNFFKKIQFRSSYAIMMMKAIEQLTKYISGYENKTSRDGTTSLAMVSSVFTKNLILAGNHDFDYKEIPSQILKEMEEVIKYIGTDMIEKDRVPIYENCEYKEINGMSGKDYMYNTLKTTTDNHPFIEEFAKLMDEALENKYDILDVYKSSPEHQEGDPDIKLEIKAGCRAKVSHIDKSLAGSFINLRTIFFVLDGYIRPEHRDIYCKHFKQWITRLCSIQDNKGLFIFDGSDDSFKNPVILITRTPDYLVPFYKEIVLNGIKIRANIEGRMVEHTVKPKILLIHNTEHNEILYKDFIDVYHFAKVDIGLIDRYIGAVKPNPDARTEEGLPVPVKDNAINLNGLFPNVSNITENGLIEFIYEVPEFEEDLDLARPDRYTHDRELFKSLKEKTVYSDGLSSILSYDGKSLHVSPTSARVLEIIKEHRLNLQHQLESYSKSAITEHDLERRLAHFSGITIKSTIVSRTDDEFHQLFSMYEDALGVFESGHQYGVLPGANTYMLKKAYVFMERLNKQLEYQFRQCSDKYAKKYREICNLIGQVLLNSYLEVYGYLAKGENTLEHLNTYTDENTPLMTVYDANRGVFEECSVIEAARTTRDVFHGAVSVAFDMLRLKRMRVESGGEFEEVNNYNKVLPYHYINEK